MVKTFKHVYQFRIDLKDIRPPIWRRIQVPENYTFWDLHVAIQNAMGWEDYHMHEFQVTDPFLGGIIKIKTPEWEQKIADWLNLETSMANYIYDFVISGSTK